MFDFLKRKKKESEMAELHVEVEYDQAHKAEGEAKIAKLKEVVESLGGTVELSGIEAECDKCGFKKEYKTEAELPEKCPQCGDGWL